MKAQRFIVGLVALNIILLVTTFRANSATTDSGIAPVLRGRALELVDEKGRVRAEIKVHPAEPDRKMPDGSVGYPETVLLRLINTQGGPNTKIATTEDGAGISLGNRDGYIQILNRGTNLPFIKFVAKDGREKVFDMK
jgi:hypothetical protein